MKIKEMLKNYRVYCYIIIAAVFIGIIILGLLSTDSKTQAINKYTLNISYHPDTSTLDCEMTLEYFNNDTVPLNAIALHLYPNAFLTSDTAPFQKEDMILAYPNGFSAGSIEVTNIKINQKNAEHTFSANKQQLFITPEHPLAIKGKCTISLDFTVTIPNADGRFGKNGDTVNLGNFYPIAAITANGEPRLTDYSSIGDPFYSNVSDYQVTVSTPSEYTLITGCPTEISLSDDTATWTASGESMRDFAMVITKNIKSITDNSSGTAVNCYYTDNDQQAKNAVRAATDAIKLFKDLYGDYPFKQFNIVQTSFFIGGMEYPGMVLIDHSYFKNGNAHPLENVVVHECAHQWWYASAGNDQINNAWIDEGLATYSTMLYYQRYKDPSTYKLYYKYYITNSYRFHRESIISKHGKIDQSMTRSLNEYDDNEIYNMLCYEKSAMMLQCVRELLGDDLFFANIKALYQGHINGIITQESFSEFMSRNTDKPVKELINSWLNDKVYIP